MFGLSGTTRNTARGRKPLAPFGLRAAQAHLLCCPSSTMLEYGLRRVALHLDPRRPQRDPWDFHYGLLVQQPSIDELQKGLEEHLYVADRSLAVSLFLCLRLKQTIVPGRGGRGR